MSSFPVRLAMAGILALAGTLGAAHGIFAAPAAQQPPSVYVHAGTYYVNTLAHPGDKVQIGGTGFTPNEFVRLVVRFPLYSGRVDVVATRVNTDGSGSFNNVQITIPQNAKQQNDFIEYHGLKSGKNARATVLVRYAPDLSLDPATTGPGQSVAVSGHGYVSYTPVEVSVTVKRTDSFPITLRHTAYAGQAGNIGTALTLPSDVAGGTYVVQAVDGTGSFTARANLTVNRAAPTSTAAPNPTAAPKPTATATPIPQATLPPAPQPALPKTGDVGFQWISLWYHTVRRGTWDEIVVQGTPHTTYGIWVHVIFANGRHYDYYQNTDSNGQWRARFNIPHDTNTQYSNQASIQFQLWHGHHSVKTYITFTVL